MMESQQSKREIVDALLDLSECDTVVSDYDEPKMFKLNLDKEQRPSLVSLVDTGSKLIFKIL